MANTQFGVFQRSDKYVQAACLIDHCKKIPLVKEIVRGGRYQKWYDLIDIKKLFLNPSEYRSCKLVTDVSEECEFQVVFRFDIQELESSRGSTQEAILESVLCGISTVISNADFENWLVLRYENLVYVFPNKSSRLCTMFNWCNVLTARLEVEFDKGVYQPGSESPWTIGDFDLKMIIPFTINQTTYRPKWGYDGAAVLNEANRKGVGKQALYEAFVRTRIGFASQW